MCLCALVYAAVAQLHKVTATLSPCCTATHLPWLRQLWLQLYSTQLVLYIRHKMDYGMWHSFPNADMHNEAFASFGRTGVRDCIQNSCDRNIRPVMEHISYGAQMCLKYGRTITPMWHSLDINKSKADFMSAALTRTSTCADMYQKSKKSKSNLLASTKEQ